MHLGSSREGYSEAVNLNRISLYLLGSRLKCVFDGGESLTRVVAITTTCIVLLAFFVAAAGAAQQHQPTVRDVVKASIDSLVLIVVSDEHGKPSAEGSGFIASPDGKIVTNHHVIADAHSAIAKLNNGAFFTVDGIVFDDPDYDIAVIKVTGKNLPYLTLTGTDNMSVGDHVVAIGSPLGLENTEGYLLTEAAGVSAFCLRRCRVCPALR